MQTGNRATVNFGFALLVLVVLLLFSATGCYPRGGPHRDGPPRSSEKAPPPNNPAPHSAPGPEHQQPRR